MPLIGAMPVIAPFRGESNHQFTGGYDYSLSIAAQVVRLSFLTYLFDSSCAKCETIVQVIRLSSIFSCMRTPSSRLNNFTFRIESADQICRQACLITI